MNVTLTLAITKTAAKTSRLLGRGGGGALPGVIADRLDKGLARKLIGQIPHGVIIVTGTNGKTTTTKMLAGILEACGERVLTNRSGSNLRRGVLSSLIGASNWRGRIPATIALFEVDEASLRRIAPELQPRHIVVLNLFRDQLDRYGELDTTAALIGQGIAATKAQVHLNADDPLVASLAKYAGPGRVHFFGIEGMPASSTTAHPTAADSDRCPHCGTMLAFSRIFYGHIGHYACPKGDFARPQPSTAITSVERADLEGSAFTLAVGGKRHEAKLALPGTYNLYNALASVAVSEGMGLPLSKVVAELPRTEAAFGRVEIMSVDGRKVYLLLIKNPAGFAQVMETFLLGSASPHILMLINDDHADGRDISWLWDVPLEALEPLAPNVTTSGTRGSDMLLRLKYAGVTARNVASPDQALKVFLAGIEPGGTGFILPTYTAMTAIRRQLGRSTTVSEVRI